VETPAARSRKPFGSSWEAGMRVPGAMADGAWRAVHGIHNHAAAPTSMASSAATGHTAMHLASMCTN
jgi:hypothetical protein